MRLADKVQPGVVQIRVGYRGSSDSDGEPPQRGGSRGSGFLIHPDGYILTAYHVIDRAREIEVRLPDRRRHRARLIGAEPDAEKGKVHPHDVILAINGIQVDTPRELIRVIGGSEAGSKVKLTIFREGEIFDLTVTLGTKPKKVEGREG